MQQMRFGPAASASMRLLVSVLVAAIFQAVPQAAAAHQQLLRSEPANGAHLSATPAALRLVFNEAVELAVSRLALTGPSGNVALSPIRLHDDSASVLLSDILGSLEAGTYRVTWQVVGSDGHPVRGEYAFTIAPGASGIGAPAGVPAPGHAAPPAEHHQAATFPAGSGFGAESPLYAAIRWLTFVGLLAVIGVAAFRLLVLRLFERTRNTSDDALVAPAAERARRFGLIAVGLLSLALLLRLFAQSYALHGPADVLDFTLISTMLMRTMWGWGWLLQFGGTALVLLGLFGARLSPRAWWGMVLPGVIMLAATPGLSGHAVAVPTLSPLAVGADTLHVLGAGGWLGSLLLVLIAGIPVALRQPEDQRASSVAALINAFSPTALFFAGIVVATGVFAAWIHIGSVSGLWESAYGRTLLVKLSVLSLVFGTGAYNWLKVRPALGEVAAAHRLRRSAALELAVGVIVLVVTAVLVATPPPTEHVAVESAQVRSIDNR